jgi:sec-independent protein translocase protein TatB
MFDIAWSELALIGAVALIVIGPKDLPKVMRTAGQWARKARLLAGEFQRNVEDMIREAELDEVRRQVQQAVDPTAIKEKVEALVDAKAIEEALKVEPETVASATTAADPAAAEAVGSQAAAEVPVLPENLLSLGEEGTPAPHPEEPVRTEPDPVPAAGLRVEAKP